MFFFLLTFATDGIVLGFPPWVAYIFFVLCFSGLQSIYWPLSGLVCYFHPMHFEQNIHIKLRFAILRSFTNVPTIAKISSSPSEELIGASGTTTRANSS